MTRLAPVLPVLLLLVGCGSEAPPLEVEEFLSYESGRRWTYDVTFGGASYVLTMASKGGDVRTLDGVERVRFQFTYGGPPDEQPDITKSIYALPASGPREFYFDGYGWALFHDPPIALLPREPNWGVGSRWPWSGRVEFGSVEADTSASSIVNGREEVTVPAGIFEALRTKTTYEDTELVVQRWIAPGVGVVRMDVRTGSERATLALREHGRVAR